jgi:uncharacterized membrane protein HdeD (DUF308 family)
MTENDNGAVRPTTGWGWVLAYGIVVILVGLLALSNPLATGVATGFLIGTLLIVYGAFATFASLSYLSGRARWIELILGIMGLLAGAVTIFSPFAGALSLVMLIGAWLLISGILEAISAFRSEHDWGWRLLLGILDLVLGGLILFSGPATGLIFLAFCVGISFLIRGVFLFILALGLRRLARI